MSPRLKDASPQARAALRPKAKPKSRSAQALALNPTLVGFAIFALLMLGGLTKFLLELPTPQELVVRKFFRAIADGDYPKASGCLEGGRFEVVSNNSTIRGVPGGDVSLAGLIADEAGIQAGLPQAQLFVSQFRFDTLKSQRDKSRDRKTVQFEIAFDLYPGGRRPMGPAPPNALSFVLEGHAITIRQQETWVIHALDFRVVPQPGTSVTQLLKLVQNGAGSFEGL